MTFPSILQAHLTLDEQQLKVWCRKWSVVELAFFGSVMRNDFRPDSDVDVLVAFAADSHLGLFEFNAAADELEGILGRKVDLLTRRGVESSRNPYRKQEILQSAQVVYAA